MRGSVSKLGLLLIVLGAGAVVVPGRSRANPASDIAALIARLRSGETLVVSGARIAPSRELITLYGERGYQPLWTRAGQAAALLQAIRGLYADGLTPSHYHESALSAAETSPVPSAALDLLRTDALLRAARDVRYGRAPELSGAMRSPGGADELLVAMRGGLAVDPGDALRALRPTHFTYSGLVAALAQLRRIEASGGWAPIADGVAMRLDTSDARVALLRVRLQLEGDLPSTVAATSPVLFDTALDRAVRRFQHRHGLNEDGVVGPRTLAALNIPVARRIEAVRVNLERARWIARDLPPRYVAVNAAGAKVYLLAGRTVVFEARAIVGATYTTTPVFAATMQHIELNPSWTVPPGIVGEVLAQVRRDAGYLQREGMYVLDRAGRRVAASGIDFDRYTARSFPYVFRQAPGPRNPLGRIKFVFPNQYNVYLHDTPARALFSQEERLFSHGCVRVQSPLQLAQLILDDPAWTVETLEAAITTGEPRVLPLTKQLRVLVLYWTASADLHGELHFYPDVYGRDAAVLAALEKT